MHKKPEVFLEIKTSKNILGLLHQSEKTGLSIYEEEKEKIVENTNASPRN